MIVELSAYFLLPSTLIVIMAVPCFIAVTKPLSVTLTIPESSGTKVTFKPVGSVV